MESRKKEKRTIPIIPHSSLKYNQDASSLLREVFQDVLEEPVLPENVVRNWTNYKIDSDQDSRTAHSIHTVMNQSKLEMEALEIVEKKLAYNMKTNLEIEKQINADPKQKEFKLFKRDLIFPKIDQDDVNDYGLITGEDLKPSKMMQKLDFTYEPKSKPKVKRTDLDMVPTKLPNIKKGGGDGKNPPPKGAKGPHKGPPPLPPNEVLTTRQDIQAWNNLCLRGGENTKRKSLTSLIKSRTQDPANFRLDKETISFDNYKLNTVYKKRFKLQNISSCLQRISLLTDSENKSSGFKVVPQFDPETLRLCAGMSACFVVYFKAELYFDIEDYYEVNGHKVKLVSFREPPNLTAFILRNTWPAKLAVHPRVDVLRAQALNHSIECGACFVGEHLTAHVIFKNNGGPGKFFMMTEMQWLTLEIDSLHKDLQLEFGDFSITPNYFELDKGDFAVATVGFYGAASSTSIENIILVCNNITWETIDFIADVIVFDKYTITFDRSKIISIFTFQKSMQNKAHACPDNYSDWESTNSSIIASAAPVLATSAEATIKEEHDSATTISSLPRSLQPASVDVALRTSSADIIDEVIFDYLIGIEKEQSRTHARSWSEEHVPVPPTGVLYFGKTLGFKELRRTTTIYNNTMINLKYRWELREIDVENYDSSIKSIKQLGFEYLTFDGGENSCLPAYGHIACGINLCPETTEESFYALSFGLVVENIPQCAVKLNPQNKNFMILQPENAEASPVIPLQPGATPSVDVQICQFDAFCYVMGLRILIVPRNIFGSHTHICGKTVQRVFKLIVDCDNQDELTGCWVSNKLGRVIIQPENFTIRAHTSKIFDLEYFVDDYSTTMEQICVEIEEHYSRTIDLQIQVEPPHLKFDRQTLNIGLLNINNSYEGSLIILNQNHVNVDWEIREQYKKDLDRPGLNAVEVGARNLECGNVLITYRVQACVPIKWSSYLHLFTIYANKKIHECQVEITYEIVETTACVHTDFSECSILSPSELLYINSPKTYSLCFHNLADNKSLLEFEETYGAHAQLVDISIAPKRFTVEAQKTRRVDCTITPHQNGIYDEIFLSFNQVDDNPNRYGVYSPPPPTIVTVMVAVDDIFIKVILPNDQEIFWPPRNTPSVMFGTDSDTDYDMPSNTTINTISNDIKNIDENSNCDRTPVEETDDQVQGHDQSHDDTSISMDSMDTLPSDLVRYLKTLEAPNGEADQPPLQQPETISSSSFSSDTTVTEPSCSKLAMHKGFENVSKHVIEICGVPLKKIYRCNLKIENLTPVNGFIKVENLNFPPNDYKTTKIDVVLQKLKYKAIEDEWEKRTGTHGIVISHEFSDGLEELAAFGKKEIVLSIYANTWGTYKEDLIINVNDILPMRISVIVEITGVPLEFPIAVNNIHKTAILRFGTLAYQSTFEIRHLQVRNMTVLPVTVTWHIVMRHSQPEFSQQPITVLYDVYHPDDDDLHDEELTNDGNCMILHGKCIGKSEHRIFKMYPKEMQIGAKQTITIKLGINARAYAASYSRTEIEAYMIGYTHLTSALSHSSSLYRRPTGHAHEPIKAKLTATLDLPVLKLEMSSEDLHLAFYADQICDVGYTKQTRHLTLKNRHAVEAVVRFHMDLPFVLESCRTASRLNRIPTTAETTPRYVAEVGPEDCVQLAVSYEIDTEALTCIARSLFDESYDEVSFYSKLNFNEHTFSLVKYLHIEQKGFVRQNIPVTLTIYFPVLEVTDVLDFGNVYIGNVSKELCIVKNYSACRVEFSVEESKTFCVVAKSGVIKPGRQELPTIYDLYIVFIPQMQKLFEETIVINTQIPSLCFEVKVSGVGRQNEHCYKPETC